MERMIEKQEELQRAQSAKSQGQPSNLRDVTPTKKRPPKTGVMGAQSTRHPAIFRAYDMKSARLIADFCLKFPNLPSRSDHRVL